MVYDPVWNNFVNSGNVNDYLTYSKNKNSRIKKVSNVDKSKSNSNK